MTIWGLFVLFMGGRRAVVTPFDNPRGLCYWRFSALNDGAKKVMLLSFCITLHPGQPYLRDQPGAPGPM